MKTGVSWIAMPLSKKRGQSKMLKIVLSLIKMY